MADRTRSLEAIGAAYISLGSLNVCHKNLGRIYLARLLGAHDLCYVLALGGGGTAPRGLWELPHGG